MTSINAIRFNHYEGACVCDESISSTDDMRIDVSDKIQPCIPSIVVEKYGIVGALGTTGSCSIGDEIKLTFMNRISHEYEAEIEKHGKAPLKFLGLPEMACFIFDSIVEMKYRATTNIFRAQYGFSVAELIEGSYPKDKQTVEIKDKDTIRDLSALLSWKYQQPEVSFIFGNAALFAGYDEENGFVIFHYDLRSGHWHQVPMCYLAEGSGRHSVDPIMYPYAENLLLEDRRGNLDRVEGLMALLHALNAAMDHEIGVGGYPNIILIDGRQSDHQKRLREIGDERSLLACQILRAVSHHYLDHAKGYSFIDALIYGAASFDEIYEQLFAQTSNNQALARLLRGYKILPFCEDLRGAR